MQKKERKQRRHLPGWCGSLLDKDPGELPGAQDIYPISSAHIGSGRISWWAPLGPGLLSLSPQHRFPPICPLPHFFGQHREYFQGQLSSSLRTSEFSEANAFCQAGNGNTRCSTFKRWIKQIEFGKTIRRQKFRENERLLCCYFGKLPPLCKLPPGDCWLIQATGKGSSLGYGTRRRYNLMSQALVASHVNDWLGWFYPGYSGFHPQKRIKKIKEKKR